MLMLDRDFATAGDPATPPCQYRRALYAAPLTAAPLTAAVLDARDIPRIPPRRADPVPAPLARRPAGGPPGPRPGRDPGP